MRSSLQFETRLAVSRCNKAAKGDQVLSVAGVTSHPQETVFKPTAFKVFLEFLPDVIRQYPALGRPLRLENGIVLFDKLVKKGPLWTMALVLRRTLAQTGFPASWQPPRQMADRTAAALMARAASRS